LFRRSKLTLSCSAEGKEGWMSAYLYQKETPYFVLHLTRGSTAEVLKESQQIGWLEEIAADTQARSLVELSPS
jgi:hypothetical protein